MAHYSYSKLSTFESCPYRFNKKYNLKKKEPETDLLVVGQLCHTIIEQYSTHLREVKQATDFTVIPEIIDRCLAEKRRHDLADEVTDLIIRFSKSFMIHDTIFDTEHKFGLDHNLSPIGWPKDSKGWNYVFFVGIIDRIDVLDSNHIKITDYKSGWSTDVDKFQLRLYALALSHIFPQTEKFTIELDFIRLGIQKTYELGLEELIKTKEKLFQLVNEVEATTQWIPRAGNTCKYCGFIDSCPAMKNALNSPMNGEVLTEDQALRAAEDILLLDAQLDSRRKALQGWVKIRGPVDHNGFNFGYQLKETDEIDRVAELIKTLESYQSNLDKYFNVSAANKKKLKKDYPDIYASFSIVKQSTRWGVVKEEV